MRPSNSPRKVKHSNSTVTKLINTLSAVGKASQAAENAKRSISPDLQSSMFESDEKSKKKISSKFIMTPNRRIEEQDSIIKTLKAQINSLNKCAAEQAQSVAEKEHLQKNLNELKDIINKTTDEYNTIADNISTKLATLTSENIKIKQAHDELQMHYKDVHAKYEVIKNYPKLEPMLTIEKSINTEINALLTQNYQKFSDNFSIVKSEKEGYFEKLKEITHNIDGEREDHRKSLAQWAAEKIQLNQQIQDLNLKNTKNITEISKFTEINKSYECQVTQLQSKMVFYEEELKEKQRQDAVIKELTKSLGEIQTNYSIGERKFEEGRKRFGGFELTALLEQTNAQLTETKKQNTDLTSKLIATQKDLDICNLRLNVILPKEKCILSVEQQLQDSNERITKINESNIALQNELKKVNEEYTKVVNLLRVTIDEDNKLKDERSNIDIERASAFLEKNKLIDENQKLIEENDKVVNALSALRMAVFESQRYVADPKDAVDCKLAEALNKYLKENYILDIVFNRQGDGNYLVGTKKFIMKLDAKDNLIVRAGTGYVTIQEFLKVFLPPELDKLRKSATFKNLSSKMEKVQSYLVSLTDCMKNTSLDTSKISQIAGREESKSQMNK